jgi:quinol monooxygenase YgiN
MYEMFEEAVHPTEGTFVLIEWWESQEAIQERDSPIFKNYS